MKQNPDDIGAGKHSASAREPAARFGVVVIILAVILLGGAVIVYMIGKRPRTGPEYGAAPEPSTQQLPVKEAPVVVAPVAEAPVPSVKASSKPTVTSQAPQSAAPSVPAAPSLPEPTAHTRQLVTTLSRLDLSSGVITPERADEWKLTLQQLVQQGAAAVPAIREFLEGNQDLNLEAISGGDQLGQPSLRMALLNALQAIGGPEAAELSFHTLQSATDPREIAALANYLEGQAPGQYVQLALDATRRSLALASTGKLEGKDVGPLFGVFQQYGGAAALPDLENALSQWKYYSAITLAKLPDGAGIPALLQMAQASPEVPQSTQIVALQVLAQVAQQYPEARTALIEQARQNQIPNATWLEIVSVLEGHTFQIGNQRPDNFPAGPEAPRMKSYHLSFGNQNFYTTESTASWPPEQINERITLINELLRVSTSPIALEALQRSRTVLLSKLQP